MISGDIALAFTASKDKLLKVSSWNSSELSQATALPTQQVVSVEAHVFIHGQLRLYLDCFIIGFVAVVLIPVLRRWRQNYLSRSLLVDMLGPLLIATNHESIEWSVYLV